MISLPIFHIIEMNVPYPEMDKSVHTEEEVVSRRVFNLQFPSIDQPKFISQGERNEIEVVCCMQHVGAR